MVASINSSDLYSPFQHPSMVEEGPQSSEDGSGLHSPVFGQSNDFRYQDQVDIEDAAGMLHFDYASSIIQQQQPPLIDTTLVAPSPSAHHVDFSTDYSIAARNQLGIQYLPQSSVNTRVSHFSPDPGGEPLDLRYNSSERRSSGRQSHDPMVRRTMEGDQPLTPVSPVEHSEPSTAHTGNRSRERRETSTVVIACRQCRSRKIRCDSARPVCTNCHRRKNICEYDAAPKRRGPDKRPGTRRRSCKKRPADGSTPPPPKRKKTETEALPNQPSSPTKTTMSERKRSLSMDKRGHDPVTTASYEDSPPMHYKSPYPGPLDIDILRPAEKMIHHKFPAPSSPTMESAQHDWWTRFLTTHSSDQKTRIEDIAGNAEYLFSDTGHWISFLNLDYFVETLWHAENRYTIRPPLILSILAMATLMKSSQAEYGIKGREQALMYRDSARSALDSSWNSGWVDPMLAEAALILTLFETSVHPQFNPDRISDSLVFLDEIIRHLGLTSIDGSDPDVCVYPRGGVPVVITSGPDNRDRKCTCIPIDATHPPDPVTSWSYPPPWDSSWTPVQIRDEECRRVCWCAVGLIASYNAQCVAFDRKCPNLFLSDCSNFTLLFPGEVVDRASPTYRSVDSHSPKESVWALYCRSMLLWNYSNRLGEQSKAPSETNAELAQESWSESQAIQDSLEMHICNLDTALIYMTREYIYKFVFTLSKPRLASNSLQGLSTSNRILNRRQAQDWLYYQDQVIKRVKMGIQEITDPRGHQLTRRPFQATWFSNQLSMHYFICRCLMLFHHDRSLIAALDLAKSIVIPIDVLNVLWPCPLQQRHCAILREQLIGACNSAGVDPPSDPEFSIPPALQSM
ncbi:hypothetical protein J3R30DRAFT_3277042 [Lentinula aciculospora]|uniref:Zn(2)-C6 fungal-type domain-containing protein n=1 Tax=Lentinula aciculospora TaxID=153920 RepID=A0A9W9AUN1_9AGAR|nr:hypothetical protein J3R30DRAFT_3277042 [Lentinula aciculospora]